MPSTLRWHVASAAAATFSQAQEATKGHEGARLPTLPELVDAIEGGAHLPAAFTFAVESAWCDDGRIVKPSAAASREGGGSIVRVGADGDSAAVVLVLPPPIVERPARQGKRRLTVSGFQDLPVFQQCVEAAAYLNEEYADEYAVTVQRQFGFVFEERRAELAKLASADPETATMRVLVYDEDAKSTQSGEAFIAFILRTTRFRLFESADSDPQSYGALARRGLAGFLAATQCSFVFLSIRRGEQLLGRVVLQLFQNICPKTCSNFVHLCRGDLPDVTTDKGEKVKLSYRGSTIFRVVANGWIQGGDITGSRNGTGGWSIFGRHFPDESFAVPHDAKGILGMANDGEHTNSSSFYITVGKSSWMNTRYVAFGRVVEGLTVIDALHATPTKHNQSPVEKIVIDDCGLVEASV